MNIDEYPHSIYQQVLLLGGKIVDWKISHKQKQNVLYWNTRSYCHIRSAMKLTMESIEIVCNNSEEHNNAFDNDEWFKQFEIHEEMIGLRPY